MFVIHPHEPPIRLLTKIEKPGSLENLVITPLMDYNNNNNI